MKPPVKTTREKNITSSLKGGFLSNDSVFCRFMNSIWIKIIDLKRHIIKTSIANYIISNRIISKMR